MLNKEQKIVDLLNKGYNTTEIINALNVKVASIYYYAKKHKIKIPKKYIGGKHDKYILENLQAGKTQKMIAEELKISTTFVQQRVKALADEEARVLKLNGK